MLYLNPPYYSIDGVTLMPDHADPLQFYFMPMSPHLSTMETADGLTIPKIQLIKFTGDSSSTGESMSGGFVDFDCNLGVHPDQLAEIAAQLQAEAQLPELPRIAPVPLIDGTVRMMLFGAQTPEDDDSVLGSASSDVDVNDEFVLKINHHAKPSLYDPNQAAFSVQLDQEGVTILEQALQGELAPIGVIYSLKYVGLRPAYNVNVEVDWNRVQTHFEQNDKVNVPLVASVEIIEAIDELVEDQTIKIETDLLIADGEDDSGATGRYDAALAQVRELIFENFFEPSLEPMPRETDGDGVDDFGRVLETIHSGGKSALFSRKEVDLTRTDNKQLNINMSERTSVIREIHPQGHLSGIARTIREQGLDLDRFIIPVRLDDDFFARRTVRVIPRVDWVTDEIESINVSLAYNGEVQNVVLDPATAEQSVEWLSSLDDGQMRADVTVSYELTFSSAVNGRPRSIRSEPEVIRGEVVEISPRSDMPYEIRWVSFNVIDVPWDVYHTAEIDCHYSDPTNSIEIRNQYALTHEFSTGAWPVFALDPSRRSVRYRLILHGYDGRDWRSDWLETDDDQIRIADPYSNRRTLDIVAPTALFGSELDRVFVDVNYSDEANNIRKRESFELSAADSGTKRFMVELADAERRTVTFSATMLMVDGTVIEVPESSTDQERIIVSPRMRGRRRIQIATDGGDFGVAEVEEIRVEARYDRPAAGLHFATEAVLTAATPTAGFEFDFADNDDTYSYRIIHRLVNGLTRDSGEQTASAPALVVPVA